MAGKKNHPSQSNLLEWALCHAKFAGFEEETEALGKHFMSKPGWLHEELRN